MLHVQHFKNETEIVEKKAAASSQMKRTGNVPHGSELKQAAQSGFAKALLHQELTQQRESKLAHDALILVRREALRRVLEEERQLFAVELSQKGLAIYQQRI